MARRLKTYNFPDWSARNTRIKYPWEKWADGSPWELKRGEDFKVKPRHFYNSAWMYAQRQGLRLQAHYPDGTGGDRIVIKFSERPKPVKKPPGYKRGRKQ